MGSLYRRHRFPPEIISHAVWLYHRFALSFRDVEDLLAERGITVSYEAIRSWCRKFGPAYARALRRRQGRLGDIWHVDEVFITIRGERHYPWRAVDQDDDVLDILVTRHSDRKAAKRFFRKVLKHQERRRCNLLPTSCEATRLRTERSSHPLHIEPGNTKTTELKSPTSTPGSRNAKCADSSQRHTLNDFSRSTARFTTCSELHVIISKRSTIVSCGSELSLTGRRRRVPAEREKPQADFRAKSPSRR